MRFELLVDTPVGRFIRRIPDATPLLSGPGRGYSVEEATRQAVSRWGLPDFIYRPVMVERGSGRRELGDGLILTDARAVIVQVKSRNSNGRLADDTNWLRKSADKGFRQGRGTYRSLCAVPHKIVNLRGREVVVDSGKYEWLTVVVIDHPSPPDSLILNNPITDLPGLVLLRSDWEFLFNQLRSTHAVVDYLFRVVADPQQALGREPLRYYELAQADEEALPKDLPGRLKLYQRSEPKLPKAPVGHTDSQAHLVLRVIMEDIATSPLGADLQEGDRVQVLAALDKMHVGYRAEFGVDLLSWIGEVASVGGSDIKWKTRRMLSMDLNVQLIFAACTRFSNCTAEGFRQLVLLRHYDWWNKQRKPEDLSTVGVMLTPRHDDVGEWDTTMIRVIGDPRLSTKDRRDIRSIWSDPNLAPPARRKKHRSKRHRR